MTGAPRSYVDARQKADQAARLCASIVSVCEEEVDLEVALTGVAQALGQLMARGNASEEKFEQVGLPTAVAHVRSGFDFMRRAMRGGGERHDGHDN
jgi:hypothetical protein